MAFTRHHKDPKIWPPSDQQKAWLRKLAIKPRPCPPRNSAEMSRLRRLHNRGLCSFTVIAGVRVAMITARGQDAIDVPAHDSGLLT